MRRPDPRASRVALVPDYLVNPHSSLYEGITGSPPPVLDLLIENDYGLIAFPPHTMSNPKLDILLEVLVGDAVSYARGGYKVVLLDVDGLPGGGLWRDRIDAEYQRLGQTLPPTLHIPLTVAGDDLDTWRTSIQAFLTAPVEEPVG